MSPLCFWKGRAIQLRLLSCLSPLEAGGWRRRGWRGQASAFPSKRASPHQRMLYVDPETAARSRFVQSFQIRPAACARGRPLERLSRRERESPVLMAALEWATSAIGVQVRLSSSFSYPAGLKRATVRVTKVPAQASTVRWSSAPTCQFRTTGSATGDPRKGRAISSLKRFMPGYGPRCVRSAYFYSYLCSSPFAVQGVYLGT